MEKVKRTLSLITCQRRGKSERKQYYAKIRPASKMRQVLFSNSDITAEDGTAAKLRLNFKEPVILCRSLAPAWRARLDKAAVYRNGDVGNGRVAGLTRTVREDLPVTVRDGEPCNLKGLAESSDLVRLH